MMNVDYQEVEKFSQLSQEWWDKQGKFKTLHDINPLRLQFIQDHITVKDENIADIGCGGGILTEALAFAGANMTGIDLAEASLAVAQQHAQSKGLSIEYRCVAVEDFALEKPEHFHHIVCMEMLEHVPDPSSIINACAKLVRPDGYVFFSTLNRNIKSYLHAIIAAEYLLKMLPKGTHDFKKFIAPSELVRMCRQAHLETVTLKGLTYNPITQQYAFSDQVDVNYMIACRKTHS